MIAHVHTHPLDYRKSPKMGICQGDHRPGKLTIGSVAAMTPRGTAAALPRMPRLNPTTLPDGSVKPVRVAEV
jgi:hypothetical protein